MVEARLLNYTTDVPAKKSIVELVELLRKHGARKVLQEYDAHGDPSGLTFGLMTPSGEQAFRLPIDTEAVFKVLIKQRSLQKLPERYVKREQAARVAWRIAGVWLKAQLALLELDMVKLDQVMLPYVVTPSGKTLYEVLVQRKFELPPG